MSEVLLTALVVLLAGSLIGLLLGSLGAGGSILAVPVLIYGLDQTALQATTGSLVVVAAAAAVGAISAARDRHVLMGPALLFGAVAIVGAVVGAQLSTRVPEAVLLAAFAVLMVVVGIVAVIRVLRGRTASDDDSPPDPIFTLHPLTCACPRALKVLVAGTVVGLLTGFLGVGGGFLIVPALVVAMGLSARQAAGTSLVVVVLTSLAALVTRAGVAGVSFDWLPVLALAAVALVGAHFGHTVSRRMPARRLEMAFAVVVLAVASWTGWQALPELASTV